VRVAERCSQHPVGGRHILLYRQAAVLCLSQSSALPAPQVCQHALQLLHMLLQSSPDLARTHLDAFTPDVVRARSPSVLAQDTVTAPRGLRHVAPAHWESL